MAIMGLSIYLVFRGVVIMFVFVLAGFAESLAHTTIVTYLVILSSSNEEDDHDSLVSCADKFKSSNASPRQRSCSCTSGACQMRKCCMCD
jgi:hypothetical protein